MLNGIYEQLKTEFASNGFRLFIVGGTVRDMLLGVEPSDYDFVTDATPKQMSGFLRDISTSFSKYGCIKKKINGIEVDITTLRIEGDYDDSRHPSFIKFVNDTKLDYVRRDFTINGMYLDEEYRLIDYCGGQIDLRNKTIRFIGNPFIRIKEDPLRILRAKRFASTFGFEIEPNSKKAIDDNINLLAKLNPEKIKEEEKKAGKVLK